MDAKSVAVGSVKSKTQWVGALVVLLGILVDNAQLVGQLIPPEYMGKAMSGVGLLFMFMRSITSTSLEEKAAPKEGGFVSVKLLLVLACLSAGFLLGGCATKPAQSELAKAECLKTNPATVCEMRGWVMESYAYLIGLNQTIEQNAKDQVWSKAQATAYLDKSRAARKLVNDVDTAMGKGDILSAGNARTLALRALTELQREVAAQARKP